MRILAPALLLLLLLPAASPQGPQAYGDAATVEEGAVAPVQTVVDALPGVMRAATAEADFDGTPDDALAEIALLLDFVAGFELRPEWPEGSVAEGTDARRAYPYVQDVVAMAARIPDEVGALARTQADCLADPERATAAEVRAWSGVMAGSGARVDAFTAQLGALAAEAPEGIDAGPVEAAAAHLRDWTAPAREALSACLAGVAERLGVEVDAEAVPFVALLPDRTWPLGTVRVVGAAPSGVRIAADGLGWGLDVAPVGGAFSARFTVPRSAGLGDHVVRVTGGVEAAPVLLVEKATVELRVTAPPRVAPGEDFRVRVEVVAPSGLLVAADTVSVAGALQGGPQPAAPPAVFAFRAPAEAGVLEAAARFPGSDVMEAAEEAFRVRVVAAGAAGEVARDGSSGGRDGDDGFWERALRWLPVAPGTPAFLILVLLVVLLLVALAQGLRRLRRRAGPGGPAAPPAEGEGWAPLGRGLVAAFAAFVAWLVRAGLARPSHTPREVGARLRERGFRAERLVTDFERVRYGGAGAPAGSGSRAPAWLERVRRRLGGAP